MATTPTSAASAARRGDPSAELVLRSQRDPVWWVEKVLGVELWSMQRSILRSIRDHRQVAVRSCHGPGKTKLAACAVLWFLTCFPDSRAVTTATKWSQVKNLLWHEVNQGYRNVLLEGGLGGVCLQTELKYPDGRYALGLSTRPGQEESFQGHHAPHILLLYDEASGVPVPVYEAGEGYMTTDGARKLMIGNPTRAEGDFYKAFNAERGRYKTHHISAFDTPAFTGEAVSENVLRHLVSKQWVEERRKAWEGTALWDVKVLGNFSKRSDENVIALHIVEDATEREPLPVRPDRRAVIGIDVARFGSDETVIAVRQERNVAIHDIYHGQSITETVGQGVRAWREYGAAPGSAYVVVDDVGVGGGVTDGLRAAGVPVTAHNGGESPYEPEEFPNRRSELWFAAAGELPTCSLPDDEQLAADLVSPKYKVDSQGRRVVEPKDATKKRLGRSPDRADAVLMTFVPESEEGAEVWS
jgi:phage terminase large subunit